MNLAAQLQAANNSPSPTKTEDHVRQIRLRNLALGAKAQSDKAIVRYRAVMEGKGWMTQRQIENALGYAATVSTCYLAKLLREEHVERRNRDGAKKFDRRSGYEWRWKA